MFDHTKAEKAILVITAPSGICGKSKPCMWDQHPMSAVFTGVPPNAKHNHIRKIPKKSIEFISDKESGMSYKSIFT